MTPEMQKLMKIIRELSEIKGIIGGLFTYHAVLDNEEFFEQLVKDSQNKISLVIDELVKHQFELLEE